MSRPLGSRILLLLVAAFVGLAATLWTSVARPAASLRLPDGSLVTLEAVTYGKEHEVILGPWWAKLVRPLVPASFRKDFDRRFHCRFYGFTSRFYGSQSREEESLVFWTFRQGIAPGDGVRRPFWPTRAVAFDEHGCEAGTVGHTRFFDGLALGEAVEAWTLPVFPRRGRTVGLRAFIMDAEYHWVRAFELTVPNPARGPHPVWEPAPLPQTQRVGELSVTLTELVPEGARPGDMRDPAPPRRTRARFRVLRGSRPAPEWKPVAITVSDATGNHWQSAATLWISAEPRGQFVILGAPWADETAWKLRVELARAAAFRPEELWTIHDLPVPLPNKPARPHRSMQRGGVTLQVHSISQLPRVPLVSRSSGHREPDVNTVVELRVSPPTADRRVTLVRATDDRGRELAAGVVGYRLRDTRHLLGLQLPSGAKALTLTLAVQKSRFVEFLAAPSRPATGS